MYPLLSDNMTIELDETSGRWCINWTGIYILTFICIVSVVIITYFLIYLYLP